MGFRPFWSRTALGTWRFFLGETDKRNFPVLEVLLGRKSGRFLPEIAQPFYGLRFGRPDPHGQEIAKYLVFGPFWPRTALGTKRNSGRKTEKRNFPVLEALWGGAESGHPKIFSPKLRNFFTLSVLADRTPRGEKLRNAVF